MFALTEARASCIALVCVQIRWPELDSFSFGMEEPLHSLPAETALPVHSLKGIDVPVAHHGHDFSRLGLMRSQSDRQDVALDVPIQAYDGEIRLAGFDDP